MGKATSRGGGITARAAGVCWGTSTAPLSSRIPTRSDAGNGRALGAVGCLHTGALRQGRGETSSLPFLAVGPGCAETGGVARKGARPRAERQRQSPGRAGLSRCKSASFGDRTSRSLVSDLSPSPLPAQVLSPPAGYCRCHRRGAMTGTGRGPAASNSPGPHRAACAPRSRKPTRGTPGKDPGGRAAPGWTDCPGPSRVRTSDRREDTVGSRPSSAPKRCPCALLRCFRSAEQCHCPRYHSSLSRTICVSPVCPVTMLPYPGPLCLAPGTMSLSPLSSSTSPSPPTRCSRSPV